MTDTDAGAGKEAQAARAELQKAQALLETDPGAARGHLAEARHLDPRDPELALGLARLEVRLGLHQDALESLRRALALDGRNGAALALSSLCCLRLGSLEQAEALAQEALGLDSGDRVALEVRADCFRAGGRWQEASRGYQALLGLRGVWGEAARARLGLKLAQCLLRQGAHAAAWEIAEDLVRQGYGGPAVRSLRRECERRNRRDVSQAFGKAGMWERTQLWFAQGQIARALSLGSRRRGTRETAQDGGAGGGFSTLPSEPGPPAASVSGEGAA